MQVLFVIPCLDFADQISIAYLSAVAKKLGHKTQLLVLEPLFEEGVCHSNNSMSSHYFIKCGSQIIVEPDIIAYSTTIRDFKRIVDFNNHVKNKTIGWRNFVSILGGSHATFAPDTFEKSGMDYYCIGEGEETFKYLLLAISNNRNFSLLTDGCIDKQHLTPILRPLIQDLDSIPFPDRDLTIANSFLKDTPKKTFYTSRGCPYSCLRGDTKVNTIYGKIPIKEIAEKYKTIPVYTYDRKTKEVFIIDAINIRKTGVNKKLVRVKFYDDTHIDCTPDHKFLMFKNGNQFVDVREYEVEAKDLKRGMSVKSYKEEIVVDGRTDISWGRRKRQKRSRMIVEYRLGRKLKKSEQVHHKDFNKMNDHPDNLAYCNSAKEHFKFHPELSERMRNNNPSKTYLQIVKDKISKTLKGRVFSKEHRDKISKAMMGDKNSMYGKSLSKKHKEHISSSLKGHSSVLLGKILTKEHRAKISLGNKGKKRSKEHRDAVSVGAKKRWEKYRKDKAQIAVNHKVKSVIAVDKKEDVYCMEVPSTSWFFANDVLVHNCSYCCNNLYNKLYKGQKIVRRFSVDRVIEEIKYVKSRYRCEFVKFGDDTFALKVDDWLVEFSYQYRNSIKIPFNCYLRIDSVDEELLVLLKNTGCHSVHLSIDSTDERVREEILKRKSKSNIWQIVDKLNLIHSYGIKTWVNYMLAAPTSLLADDLHTMTISKLGKVSYPHYSMTDPIKGTDLFNYCLKNNYIDKDYLGDMSNCSTRSVLNCFSDKDKDVRYNIYLLGALGSRLPYCFIDLFAWILKIIKPNKFFEWIHKKYYKYNIEKVIFKLL